MPEVELKRKHRSSKLEGGDAYLGSITANSTQSDHAKVFGYLIRTIEVKNGATNSVTFTVEGGFRRDDGTIDWYTLATRTDASATFATTALTVTAGSKAIYEVSPTPVTDYIRVNVSTANALGTQFYAHVEL